MDITLKKEANSLELSKEQREAVETEYDKVVVISTAASGKTRTLTERVKFLLNKGVDPARIVVITFTNAAAEEMRKRIGEAKVFIGTVHSYANQILSMYGINTRSYLAREDFDGLFELIKQNPDAIQEVDHLLLDEAQDSSETQFEFLLDIIKPKNFFFTGDYRQCIYEFNKARPQLLIELSEAPGVKTYTLDENYRNASNILTFAKSFIRKAGPEYIDDSYSMRDAEGTVIKIEYDPEVIANFILKKKDYKDWFVLTRTNAELDSIMTYLVAHKIPCDTFKRATITEEEFSKKMKQDTVKVLTIHTAKGLESKNVVVIGTRGWSTEERRIQYVAATRARDLLIWTLPRPKKKRKYVDWE